MKYLLILTISVFALACNNQDHAAHQNSDIRASDSVRRAALQDTANYSEIQWIDSTHQDLGTINPGQVVEIVWRLKNSGTKPLVIADVAPGCGCTVADKPEEPIAPGGEGKIKAKFDSNNQSTGEHQKSVTVSANTNSRPII